MLCRPGCPVGERRLPSEEGRHHPSADLPPLHFPRVVIGRATRRSPRARPILLEPRLFAEAALFLEPGDVQSAAPLLVRLDRAVDLPRQDVIGGHCFWARP